MNKAMTDVLKDKRKTFLFVFLAIALVLATWYKLKIQGITMTDDVSYEEVLICENTDETHVHSAECYEKVAVTSSDKQDEINQAEEQIQDTTDTNLEESEEQLELQENEQDENTEQQLEQDNETDSQENIPEDTGQKEIAERMDSSDAMTAKDEDSIDAMATNVFALDGGSSTYALGDSHSTSRNAVNVYVNINGSWTLIGTLTQSGNSTKRINASEVTNLINTELGISLSTSQFYLYYFTSESGTFSQATLSGNSNPRYNLGGSSSYKDVYITCNVEMNDTTTDNPTDLLDDNGNTFKVYSIEEYDTDATTLLSTKYVYTSSSDGKATYTLPSEYNYYVNDSTIIEVGGTSIIITKQTEPTKIIRLAPIESNKIIIVYKVDTTPEATGLSTDFRYEYEAKKIDISIPTVQGIEQTATTIEYRKDTTKNNQVPYTIASYSTTVIYDNGSTIANLSSPYMTPYNATKDADYNSKVTTTLDRKVLKFTGWKINSTETLVQPLADLTWSQLYSYAQNGVITLTAKWEDQPAQNFVNFYINYSSKALDSETDTGSRDASLFTPSLWATYVEGGVTDNSKNIAGSSTDNSFEANRKIRALAVDPVSDKTVHLYDFPSDEYILEQLKLYADNLSIDNQAINKDDLDLEHYEIRWYVFKYQSDCCHIDGKLVRKEGKMHITKTFTGSKAAIESVTGYSFETQTQTNATSTSYHINVTGGDTNINLYTTTGVLYCSKEEHTHSDSCYDKDGKLTCTKQEHTHTTPECYSAQVSEPQASTTNDEYKLTYTWTIDVKYGIRYILQEQNYTLDGYTASAVYNVVDPESTLYENQSQGSTLSDTTKEIIGVNNFAIDNDIKNLDVSTIINVNFTNTYAPTSAITIKKEDSASNNGLANAQFSLYILNTDEAGNKSYDENSPLKFTYNESIYTYDSTNASTSKTILTSPSGGSIIIDKLPTGQSYILVEVSVPTGYDGNSSVVVELTPNEEGVIVPVITKGTGNDKDYDINKVLEVENASTLTAVKLNKIWQDDVPEEYIKDVIVELYLNNIPISNYNLNYDLNGDGQYDATTDKVESRVVLNADNGWTYTWNNLPLYVDGAKAIYTVREVQIGDVKAVTDGKYIGITEEQPKITWRSYNAYTQYIAYTTAQEETTDSEGNVTQVSFDLINTIHFVKIDINKISPLGTPIDGVKFRLQKVDDLGNIDSTFEARELTTLANGTLSFKDLEYDTIYVITEIEANKGYYLDSTPIYVMIKRGTSAEYDTLVLYKAEEDEENDTLVFSEAVAGDYEYVSLNDAQDTLNIINISHTPMPKAGGCGVYSFYILGIFLMGCSTIIIYLRKNKIKKGK